MDEREAYGLWESVGGGTSHLAEFTLEWELPALLPRRSATTIVPAARADVAGRFDPATTTTRT